MKTTLAIFRQLFIGFGRLFTQPIWSPCCMQTIERSQKERKQRRRENIKLGSKYRSRKHVERHDENVPKPVSKLKMKMPNKRSTEFNGQNGSKQERKKEGFEMAQSLGH